jgi:hypothetical protein
MAFEIQGQGIVGRLLRFVGHFESRTWRGRMSIVFGNLLKAKCSCSSSQPDLQNSKIISLQVSQPKVYSNEFALISQKATSQIDDFASVPHHLC